MATVRPSHKYTGIFISMGMLQDAHKWAIHNKLRAVGYIWGGGLAASLAYQYSKPIPPQLKVMHSRIYAQGLTLFALGAVAAVTLLEEDQHTHNH